MAYLLRENRNPTKLRGGISYPLPLHQEYTMALDGNDNRSVHDHVSESSGDEHMSDYDTTIRLDTHVDQEVFSHLLTRTMVLEK